MGYPSWGRCLLHFLLIFGSLWTSIFIGILTGSFQEFSESNPEMKASSWKTVAATRALFSPERRQFWRFLNDRSQVKRGGGLAACGALDIHCLYNLYKEPIKKGPGALKKTL